MVDPNALVDAGAPKSDEDGAAAAAGGAKGSASASEGRGRRRAKGAARGRPERRGSGRGRRGGAEGRRGRVGAEGASSERGGRGLCFLFCLFVGSGKGGVERVRRGRSKKREKRRRRRKQATDNPHQKNFQFDSPAARKARGSEPAGAPPARRSLQMPRAGQRLSQSRRRTFQVFSRRRQSMVFVDDGRNGREEERLGELHSVSVRSDPYPAARAKD